MAAGGFTNDFLTAFLMVLIKPQIFLLEKIQDKWLLPQNEVFLRMHSNGRKRKLYVVSLRQVSNALVNSSWKFNN